MTQVSVHEARNNLSRLIKQAQEGEEIVIASHGRPAVRLVPVRPSTGRDLIEWLDANPLPPGTGRSAAEVAAHIKAERDSWE